MTRVQNPLERAYEFGALGLEPPQEISLKDHFARRAEVPQLPEGSQRAAEAVMDRLDWYRDNGKVTFEQAARKFEPFIRDADGAQRVGRAVWSASNLESGDFSDKDVDNFAYMMWRSELEDDKSFLRKVAEGIGTMPAFIAEFAITGGPIGWGFKKVGTTTGKGALKAEAKRVAREKLGLRMAAGTTLRGVSLVTSQVLRNPQMVGHATARQMAENFEFDVDEDEALRFMTVQDPKGFWEAMGRGLTETAIELGTERAGAGIGALRKSFGAIPKESKMQLIRSAIINRFLKANPGTKPTDLMSRFLRKGNWHGFFAEMGEEQLGKAAEALLLTGEWRSMFDLEQLALEGLTLGGFQGGVSGLRKLSKIGGSMADRAEAVRRKRAEAIEEATEEPPTQGPQPKPKEEPAQQPQEQAAAQQPATEKAVEQPTVVLEEGISEVPQGTPIPGSRDIQAAAEGETVEPRPFTVESAADVIAERAGFSLERLEEIQKAPSRRAFDNEFGISIPKQSDRQAIADLALDRTRGAVEQVREEDPDVEAMFTATPDDVALATDVAKGQFETDIKAVEPSTTEEQDAVDYVRSFGLKPLLAEADGPLRGLSVNDVVVIERNPSPVVEGQIRNPTDVLWGLVSHEIAHGTGMDQLQDLPEEIISEYSTRYLSRIANPAIRQRLLDRPDGARREGVAELIQEFMTDPEFRAQIRKKPGTFSAIRDSVFQHLGGFTPKAEAARKILNELRSWEDTKSLARQFGLPIKGTRQQIEAKIKEKQDEIFAARTKRPLKDLLEETPKAGQDDIEAMASLPWVTPKTPTPSQFDWINPAITDYIRKNYGIRGVPLRERIVNAGRRALTSVRRARALPEFFGDAHRWDAAREGLRLSRSIGQAAAQQAQQIVRSILDPMTMDQKTLFSNYLIATHQAEMLKRGEGMRIPASSAAEVQRELSRFQDLVNNSPPVAEALRRRRESVGRLVDELVARKLLPAEARDSTDTFFHMQIHAKKEIEAHFGGRRMEPVKRGFQHTRIKNQNDKFNPDLAFNTDYLQSEMEWVTDAIVEIEKQKVFNDYVKRPYDIKGDMMLTAAAERDRARKAKLPDAAVAAITWDTFVPDGYEIYTPEPGTFFYTAMTLPEKILEEFLKNPAAVVAIDKDDLRQAIAIGAARNQVVIPTELAGELKELNKPRATGDMARYLRRAQTAIKGYLTVYGPGVVPFNLRNLFGDFDAATAMGTDIKTATSRVLKAGPLLWNFYRGNTATLPPRLQSAVRLGVIDAGMAEREIPGKEEWRLLQKYMKQRGKWWTIPRSGIRLLRDSQVIRESMLRYAIFESYAEKLAAGEPVYYGGTSRSTVEMLNREYGPEVAAAHLSREFVGDYLNLSIMGDWLRAYLVPFHGFRELNFRRYARLSVNLMDNDQMRQVRTLGMALPREVTRAIMVMRVAAAAATMYAFNNYFFPDEEEQLSAEDKATPHIDMGRNQDGSIRVLRDATAIGDLTEMTGLSGLPHLMRLYEAGQISGKDIVLETGKSAAAEAFSGISPLYIGALNALEGQTRFPDPFNPRSMPSLEGLATAARMRDEYLEMSNYITQDGRTARGNYVWRHLTGISEPKREAIFQIYDLKARYLASRGVPSRRWNDPGPTKNMRDAVVADNYERFVIARRRYLEGGRVRKNFAQSISFLDPLEGTGGGKRFNQAETKDFVVNFLTAKQRVKLRAARDYARELQAYMLHWWDKAAAQDLIDSAQAAGPVPAR